MPEPTKVAMQPQQNTPSPQAGWKEQETPEGVREGGVAGEQHVRVTHPRG